MTLRYLLPPYRCCGVSTRRSRHWRAGCKYRVCDICGWSYKPDGTRAHNNGRLKKHDRTEIDK